MQKDFSRLKQQVRDTLYLALPPEKTLTVSTADLPVVLKKLGLDFSEDRRNELVKKLDPTEKGVIDDVDLVNELVDILSAYDFTYLVGALKALDLDNDGKIPLEEFKAFIQDYGEKMEEDDFEQMLQLAPVEDDKILIDRFAKILAIPR